MPYDAAGDSQLLVNPIFVEILSISFASSVVVRKILSQVKGGSVAQLILQIIAGVHSEGRTLLVHSQFVLGIVKLGLVVDAFHVTLVHEILVRGIAPIIISLIATEVIGR